eukprot:363632-Chlamydomonas_euryale.AAC.8
MHARDVGLCNLISRVHRVGWVENRCMRGGSVGDARRDLAQAWDVGLRNLINCVYRVGLGEKGAFGDGGDALHDLVEILQICARHSRKAEVSAVRIGAGTTGAWIRFVKEGPCGQAGAHSAGQG